MRLYLMAEGESELGFARHLLAPHLAQFGVDLYVALAGGGRNYGKPRADLLRQVKGYPGHDVRFTTMFDLYHHYEGLPGAGDTVPPETPLARVQRLERAMHEDLIREAESAWRFIPYLQLHEFEALLLSDPLRFAEYYAEPEQCAPISDLAAEVAAYPSPEDIDEGDATSPSRRIVRHLPAYEGEKPLASRTIATAIGLPAVRQRCPHFNAWVTRLEQLAG